MFNDKNHLMRLIKSRLGIYTVRLPLTDKDLYDAVIIDATLPQFSIFCPHRHMQIINTDISQIPDDELMNNNTYSPANLLIRIPNPFGYRKILGVNRIGPYISLSGMTMSSSYETMEAYQDLAIGQSIANLASTMMPPKTFEFLPPDKVRLYNNFSFTTLVEAEVFYYHHNELHTIPDTARDSFFKLALLDMKVFLYNNLKIYNEMETAFGKLNLKVDDWSNAEQERSDLIQKWEDTYHLDQNCLFFI